MKIDARPSTPLTPEKVQARQDVALFFPPVLAIQIVLYAAIPTGVMALICFYAALSGAPGVAAYTGAAAVIMTLALWVFFFQSLTTRSQEPVDLPQHYQTGAVPIRFQPEIKWQAIKLALRSVATFLIFFLTIFGVASLTEDLETAIEMVKEIGPIYGGVILGGGAISVPPLALLLSRYGLRKSGQRERDGGLPKSLIRRRHAAIEALRQKWPDAVPHEGA